MKRTVLLALVALLLLVLATASVAQPPPTPFAFVNFNCASLPCSQNATTASFADVDAGCYGGDHDGYEVVHLPAIGDPAEAYCYFTWDPDGSARQLMLRVFDGPHEDSFEVQILSKRSGYITVYTYNDVNDSTWKVHTPGLRFGAGKGKSTEVHLRIVPVTDPDHVDQYFCGQVAVDWVALYSTRQ